MARAVRVGDLKVGLHRTRTVDEEGDGRVLAEGVQRRQVGGVGERQRRHRILLLTIQVQHDPACHEDLQARCGFEQVGNQRRSRDDLLKVIQHEQPLLLPQKRLERLQER